MHMLFFGVLAAICYFIPVALVSAELATGWPERGGVYAWTKQAFGERWGFFSTWLQWSYAILGVISTLYFASDTLLFIVDPKLTDSHSLLIAVSLFIVWFFTFSNLKGQKVSSMISGLCFSIGVFVPAMLIICLGILYLFIGDAPKMDMTLSWDNIVPNFNEFTTFVLLVGFVRAFGGIEAAASHANEVENPRRNYPISIFIVVLVGLTINIFGSMSVAIVIPQDQISLAAGLIDAFEKFLAIFHLEFLIKPLALLIAFGAIGSVNTWLMGPIKGLLATADNGDLPPALQKVNDKGAPSVLLIIQAVMISIVTTALLLLPNLNVAFWLSVAISMTAYSVMYMMMLLSGIRLRYLEPDTPRKYKIPFGNVGMWTVGLVGLITLIFVFIIDFFPPAELPAEMHGAYTLILLFSACCVLITPLVIFHFRKPSWKSQAKISSE